MDEYTLLSLFKNLEDYICVEDVIKNNKEEIVKYRFKSFDDLDPDLDLNKEYYDNHLQESIEESIISFIKTKLKSNNEMVYELHRTDGNRKKIKMKIDGENVEFVISYIDTS